MSCAFVSCMNFLAPFTGIKKAEHLEHLMFPVIGYIVTVSFVYLYLACKLYGCHGFPEGGGPGVKVDQVLLCQQVILEIPLDGVHFGHGVADRCAGGKNDTFAVCQFIHVPALHEQVGGFLRVGCG